MLPPSAPLPALLNAAACAHLKLYESLHPRPRADLMTPYEVCRSRNFRATARIPLEFADVEIPLPRKKAANLNAKWRLYGLVKKVLKKVFLK
ncbi:hypothetical protein L596_025468 [Steinernema carpocapsae]|uniref:Uncharacterized protein n=1 Tax=Steinernema carpocapsae TaxID=34508 RepID=A0A4U5M7X6_STECR|nr:hypothetical protein L596_025468 [Steinernema carpocapsae]